MKVKSDHRSKFSSLSNWKEEAWKKSGLQRDSNPWPPRYRCDALPTELWSHTFGARSSYWVPLHALVFPFSFLFGRLPHKLLIRRWSVMWHNSQWCSWALSVYQYKRLVTVSIILSCFHHHSEYISRRKHFPSLRFFTATYRINIYTMYFS